jgi:hypothetical protein
MLAKPAHTPFALTVGTLLQNWRGLGPGGYVSEEHQRWLIFRATMAMERKMATMLAGSATLRSMHRDVQRALGWDEDERGYKWYGILYDRAPAHVWTYWPTRRETGKIVSRLDIPRGQDGWMPLERCQLIPSTRRVQDCIQSAIEMVLSKVKLVAYKWLDDPKNVPVGARISWVQLQTAAEKGVKEGATRAEVQSCWERMQKSCQIFCGEAGKKLLLEARHKLRVVYCVNGKWVPWPFNG